MHHCEANVEKKFW